MKDTCMNRALSYCESSGKDCTLFTSNGFQMNGVVKGFDEESIAIMDRKTGLQIVDRGNLSTLIPPKGYTL